MAKGRGKDNKNAVESARPELVMTKDGLTLVSGELSLRGDFTAMAPRLRCSNLEREMLVKAAKLKRADGSRFAGIHGGGACEGADCDTDAPEAASGPIVIDATAGLGEDSFLLAAAGCNVIMYEYNPLIAKLLRDAMERASAVPALAQVAARMELREEDSVEALRQFAGICPRNSACGCIGDRAVDIVLLDPMFPAGNKSALVRKKLQLIRQIEKPCANEEDLLAAAIGAGPRKIIIKRPLKGRHLAGVKPTYSLTGKAIRYDVIVI